MLPSPRMPPAYGLCLLEEDAWHGIGSDLISPLHSQACLCQALSAINFPISYIKLSPASPVLYPNPCEAYPTMVSNGTALLTALVVDDFEDTRHMLRRMLEVRDCRVIEASDGEEAVEIARRECPDLILMDLNLPEMDGLAASNQIRECKEACKNAKIVAITAYHVHGIKEAALEAGCDDYLVKPVDLDELDRVLNQLL